MAQGVVAFTIPVQRVSATTASAATVSGRTIASLSRVQNPNYPTKYLWTRHFMNKEEFKNEDTNNANDSEQISINKNKSTAQKAKNGILLVPLVIKFFIVMAIKLLTDVVVLPILIIIRSPIWFPKYIKRLFGKNDDTLDGGEAESSSSSSS